MARLSKRALARKHLLHGLCSSAVLHERLQTRRLRVESLETRSLLAGDALASVELVVVDSQGAPLTHLEVGDAFVLQGIARDLRADGEGVFAAYTDVTFDAALASATALPTSTDDFSNGPAIESSSAGEFSEVGGFRHATHVPAGSGAAGEIFFLFRWLLARQAS